MLFILFLFATSNALVINKDTYSITITTCIKSNTKHVVIYKYLKDLPVTSVITENIDINFENENCKRYIITATNFKIQEIFARSPFEKSTYYFDIKRNNLTLFKTEEKLKIRYCQTNQPRIDINEKPIIPIYYRPKLFLFCGTVNVSNGYINNLKKGTKDVCLNCRNVFSHGIQYIKNIAQDMNQGMTDDFVYPIISNYNNKIFDECFYLKAIGKKCSNKCDSIVKSFIIILSNLLIMVFAILIIKYVESYIF